MVSAKLCCCFLSHQRDTDEQSVLSHVRFSSKVNCYSSEKLDNFMQIVVIDCGLSKQDSLAHILFFSSSAGAQSRVVQDQACWNFLSSH